MLVRTGALFHFGLRLGFLLTGGSKRRGGLVGHVSRQHQAQDERSTVRVCARALLCVCMWVHACMRVLALACAWVGLCEGNGGVVGREHFWNRNSELGPRNAEPKTRNSRIRVKTDELT